MSSETRLIRFPQGSSKNPSARYQGENEVKARFEELMELYQQMRFAQPEGEHRGFWYVKYHRIFEKLEKYVDTLFMNYDDVADRIQYLGVIKDLFQNLKNQIDGNRFQYERRICIMLYDSIHKAKAENVTKDQAEVWFDVMRVLIRGECNRDDWLKLSKQLRKSGLSWIVGDGA